MQEIKQKVEELVAAFKEQGLNPSITIWLHMSDNDLSLEQAVGVVRGIGGQVSAIEYPTPQPYVCVKSELPFIETYAFVGGQGHEEIVKAMIRQ